MVDENYMALFNHQIEMIVTDRLYILDPRFVPRLSIAVGQWLVSGLQQPSSARQSLAARQKVLSE